MFKVSALTGFGAGGGAPIEIVGSVSGNISTVEGTTHALGNIDVGPASSDKNIILGITVVDQTSSTITAFTVGGVSLTQKLTVISLGAEPALAAIWVGDISSISGSQAISVTFAAGTESVGVSGVAVSGLRSLDPTMSDTDATESASQLTITSLAANAGGIAIACGGSSVHDATSTWSALTERADVQTGGDSINDHTHTAAWDLGVRSAANETIDFTGAGGDIAAAGAGFR